MADDPAAKVRLGVFVVSGLVLTVVAVFLFGAGRIFERTMPVHMYFAETVQGLDPGAEIKYKGVGIGRVTDVAIRRAETAGDGPSRQAAIIQVDGNLLLDEMIRGGLAARDVEGRPTLRHAVERGLRVTIAWKDITGQKFLDVDVREPKAFPVPKLGFEPEEPYLPTAAGPSLADIQRDLATTISNLARIDYEGIARRVEKLLDSVAATLEGVDGKSLFERVGAAADAVRDIAGGPEMKATMQRFHEVAERVSAMAARLDEIIRDPGLQQGIRDAAAASSAARAIVEEVQKRLPDLLHDVGDVVDEVRATLRQSKIPETTEAVRDALANVEGAGASVTTLQVDVSRAMEDVADALRRIGKLAEYLERHPEALLSGRRPPGKEE